MNAAFLPLLAVLASGSPVLPEVFVSPREATTCRVLEGGRIVAGLRGGLVLLEGDTPRRVTSLDGLPGTWVQAIEPGSAQGSSDRLWVGTEGGLALVLWSSAGWSIERRVVGPSVSALLWHEGRLLVGTRSAGLQLLDPTGMQLVAAAARVPGDERIAALAAWRGSVYVGTAGGGLLQLDQEHLSPVPAGLPSPVVQAVAPWGDRLLVGTMSGLAAMGPSGAISLESTSDVRGILVDDRGVSLATFGDGLRVLGAARPADEPEAPTPYVAELGRSGDVECAATPQGLFARRADQPWAHVGWPGPESNDVSAIARLGSSLLVGTFDQGLGTWDGRSWHRLAPEALEPRVNALVADPTTGRVWVATARGLAALDGDHIRTWGIEDGLPAIDVHSLALLPGGGVIAGTARGAALVRDGAVTPIAGPLPGRRAVWAAAQEEDGTLWLGTSQGLFWRSAGGRWHRETVAQGRLPDDWVTALAIDGSTVWVGTYAHGVARLRRVRHRIVDSTPLGGGYVNPGGLTLSGGVLYAATMDGLLWRRNGAAGEWKRTAAAPGKDVTAVVDDGAFVWVASRRGLARWPRFALLSSVTR